jgi:hypothetical protein
MGSAGDLEGCMMYTSVGVPIVLPDDSIQYLLALIRRVDEQYVLIQFARRLRDLSVRGCSELLNGTISSFRLLWYWRP